MRSGKTLRDRRLKSSIEENPENFYSTPEVFTEWLLDVEEFDGEIIEPAVGDGRMAKVLKKEGYYVIGSDIVNRGYPMRRKCDFRNWKVAANVVTNPPFHLAEEFIRHFVPVTSGKVCMILRLAFLESAGRYRLFKEFPPARIYVVSQRTSMMPAILRKNGKMKAANAVSYAWFVWDRKHKGPTQLRWLKPISK